MRKSRRNLMAAVMTLTTLVATDGAGAAIVFTDAAAFDAAMQRVHVEQFDALAAGSAPASLSFDGAVTAAIAVSGAVEHHIVAGADGYGAVSADGAQFWKLRGGTTTLTLSGLAVNAFGFYYSDLESARLLISAGGQAFEPMELTDRNPNTNRFIGVLADAPFTSVTIAWQTAHGDGIGIDGMRFGYAAPVPAPRSVTLGLAGMGIFAVSRRRS